MTTTRQINHTKYNIPEIVDAAIAAVDGKALNLDTAITSLRFLGNRNPDQETIIRYARETAILEHLSRTTGANFRNQIGKISFTTREQAISGVESYLNRRIHGQHQTWQKNHR